MKILFVCDSRIKAHRLECASWIEGILTNISTSYRISLLNPIIKKESFENNEFENVQLGKRDIGFIKIPLNRLSEFLSKEDFDLFVVFGTEFAWSKTVIDSLKETGKISKTILYAQGLSGACADHYSEGLPHSLLKKRTFRDFLRNGDIEKEILTFRKREKKENDLLKGVDNFIGRTSMDYAILRKNNPHCNYFHCNDILRKEFYEGEWNYDSCLKHSIFVTQYYYPLKGFHILLKAVSYLKERYPDIKVLVAGYNPISKKKFRDTSYIRYLRKLIDEYKLKDNIEFLGNLDAKAMKERYLMSNCYVCPSTIENSPLSFAEALYLGLPCISSDVGGVSDMAEHKKQALLFPSADANLLSYYLSYLFDHPQFAIELARKARERALEDYNIKSNIANFEKVFGKVGGEDQK